MSYEKITPEHKYFGIIAAHKKAGVFACDAVDHNHSDGCPNPACFNYKGKRIVPVDKDVEENWQKFWKPLCTNTDGTLNVEQIKKELFDYSIVMGCASRAFDLVTGGRISKPNTDPQEVYSQAYTHFENLLSD